MTVCSKLDYQYGWRWLLPHCVNRGVGLVGFSEDEVLFWKTVLPVTSHNREDARRDFLIINGCRYQPDSALAESAVGVCVFADRDQSSQWRSILDSSFPYIREYALLPPGNPRVVVPLSSGLNTYRSLALHRPGRRWARVALTLSRWLARVGSLWLLKKRVLLIATDAQNSTPVGAIEAELDDTSEKEARDYALYLGSPDNNRKTVVLPMGAEPLTAITKIGATQVARSSVECEASALTYLSATSLKEAVPKILKITISPEVVALTQEYRLRRRVRSRHFENEVVKFLMRLANQGLVKHHLSGLLDRLVGEHPNNVAQEHPTERQQLLAKLREVAGGGDYLWRSRVHGDFAPWNCAWTDKGLFVYDWEASQEAGIALSDAFYYVCAPAMLVDGRQNLEETLDSALNLGKRVAAMARLDLDVKIQFAVWLLSCPDRIFTNRLMLALLVGWR